MSEEIPTLPPTVSTDGREIFDWAIKVGDAIHRECAIAALRKEISDLNPRCGTCEFWMKSSHCPREKNVNGSNMGPSMGSSPCEEHTETAWATELRAKRQAELKQLIEQPL